MANKKENSSRLLAGGRQNIAAEVKKQSGINGLLPALGAGPFHLFRLHLDLRCDVLKKVTVTFPSEKVFSQRRPFGSQTLVVAQCRGGNLPAGKHAKIRSAARYRESLAQFIVSQLDQFLLASSGGCNSVVNPHSRRETRRCSKLAISLGGRSLESTICFRPSNSVLNVWKNSSWDRSLPAKN